MVAYGLCCKILQRSLKLQVALVRYDIPVDVWQWVPEEANDMGDYIEPTFTEVSWAKVRSGEST